MSSNGNGHINRVSDLVGGLLPPQNLEAEQSVLCAILIDNNCMAGVREKLAAEDFYRDTHQILYRAICDLDDAGKPVDCIILADELIRRDQFKTFGGDEELARIAGAVPHAANALFHADIVRETAKQRAAIQFGEEMLRGGYSRSQTAGELINRTADRLAALAALRDDDPDESVGMRPWPDVPAIDNPVYHGLAGEVIRLISPHSESDPMAILGQFLVCYGNVIGRHAHWRAEQTEHYCNLFLCIVGNSSKARKGTSWDHVRWLFTRCDEEWARERVLKGLSTGEGLIWSVRDPITKREKVGNTMNYTDAVVDPGVADKRALFMESEFGSTLAIMAREGNSLSGVMRDAWDTDYLRSSPKNNAARSTGAHVSIIAHVTSQDLHRRLSPTDAENGFGNRFLWLCARRSKYLPHGGQIHKVDFTNIVRQLRSAVEFGRNRFDDEVPILRDAAANDLWEHVYPSLSEARPGVLGALTSRAEAQAMRLAAIYALLDESPYIRRHHLEAGLTFWKYCDQSVGYVFGDSLGDRDAEKLLIALREAGESGLSLKAIRRKVFQGHKSAEEIGAKLSLLARAGVAMMTTDTSTRKPTVIWKAIQQVQVSQGSESAPLAPLAPLFDDGHGNGSAF